MIAAATRITIAIRGGAVIFESSIATPGNIEENIQRGRMAMRHVISEVSC